MSCEDNSGNVLDQVALAGQVYCFLPLPVFSGLPVHMNGYFELSSNRRDIWSGSDMAGEGALRAQWNQSLLEDVIVPCYCRLLKFAQSTAGVAPGDAALKAYYSLFPMQKLTSPMSYQFRHFSWTEKSHIVYFPWCANGPYSHSKNSTTG